MVDIRYWVIRVYGSRVAIFHYIGVAVRPKAVVTYRADENGSDAPFF